MNLFLTVSRIPAMRVVQVRISWGSSMTSFSWNSMNDLPGKINMIAILRVMDHIPSMIKIL